MQRRIEITTGVGYDKQGNPILPINAEHACRKIMSEASRLFGGATMTKSEGAWQDEEGRLITEEGRVFVIYTEAISAAHEEEMEDKVHDLANFIKNSLNQQSVVVANSPTSYRFA